MNVVLLDTHAFIWSLVMSSRLSSSARGMIEAAHTVYVAPITFYEISQKHRLGKWPELDPVADQLLTLFRDQGSHQAPYTAETAMLAGSLDWEHRDPFDRMIAATAIELACPLISADAAFDELDGVLDGWKGRFWSTFPRDDPEPTF